MEGYNQILINGSGERTDDTPRAYDNPDGKMNIWLKKLRDSVCSKAFLYSKFPIIKWLPLYNLNALIHDIIAGLTVGLTAIPQGIAYAVVAGLEPQYGLYSGFMGAFVYIFLGSCKDVTIGPTAILALMAQNSIENHGPDTAVLLCFLSGCIILLFGLLHLGFLVDFISMPVTVGFTSAAAVTIGSSQIKSLLGLKGKSNDFLESWITVFENIQHTQPGDITLGLVSIVLLVLAKKLKDYQVKGDAAQLTIGQKIRNNSIWIISLGRNAFIAIMGTVAAYIFSQHGDIPFQITGNIGEGFPPFAPPPFSTTFANVTYNFAEMTTEMGSAIITIPLISILECIAIAKAFSKGKALDATQEMIALGMCNLLGSFVRSMPTTGSFTRTAVNNASGVVTQLGGLFTGGLVLLALGLLTSTFFFIPKATLAGIIIAAMFYMVEYEVVPLLWRTKKLDLIPLTVTFIACLFLGLEYGILVGIGINLLFILYTSARPNVDVQQLVVLDQDVLLVTPDQSLVFPAAEYIRAEVVDASIQYTSTATVVVDGSHVRHIDATMAKALELLVQDLKVRQQPIVLWRWGTSGRESCIGLDAKLAEVFRDEETLEELITELYGKTESHQGDDEEGTQVDASLSLANGV